MSVLPAVDSAVLRLWCRAGADDLERLRFRIDALNVFPVPDGDTGTNLHLTVAATADALAVLDDAADLGSTGRVLSRAALLGARGNSGVILSQLLRGLVEGLSRPTAGPSGEPGRTAAGRSLAEALQLGAEQAWDAVSAPVEGTVLSVASAAAAAARAALPADVATVAAAAADGARAALARTPEQLEPLRLAGVVDAGGAGLCVLLDALARVLGGPHAVRRDDAVGAPADAGPLADAVTGPNLPVRPGADLDPTGRRYEVMYLLEADDAAVARLRPRLSALGDSLVVVGGDGLWNVHVHVDEAGPAIEAGIEAGRPYRLAVTHFGDQLADTAAARRDEAPGGVAPAARPTRRVVSVAIGAGLAHLYAESGAQVVTPGAGRRASAGEILDAVRAAGAHEVVVLPNDRDTLPAAELAAAEARAEGVRVAVVPTVATVQAVAALAVHDPARTFDEDVVAMTAAAGHTRHGGVTIAAKEAITSAGRCMPGDVLGIVDGDFVRVGGDLYEAALDIVERLLAGGGELVTLLVGAPTPSGERFLDPEALAERVTVALHTLRPDVEVVRLDGGQPRYPLLVGVE